jgi:putative acetyltransferase
MTNLSIEPADPTTPQARTLLEASHAVMGALFPQEANHFLSVEKLKAPHINFFVAKEVDDVLGCAALADHGSYGEVKSMFVASQARRRGVADRLLSHLEDTARSKAMTTLCLETGQPGLEAAHRLYERHGFKDCAAFGDYEADAPYSRYMELKL